MNYDPDRKKGPVEILCKEIGYHFDRRMETVEMLVAFVQVLVSHIALMRAMQAQLAGVTGNSPSADSEAVLGRVLDMLNLKHRDALITRCSEVHEFIHQVAPDEAYPCDHLIDMLSSCVSAIRFGLEYPCMSRHASSAGQHIWKHVYGIRLFDSFTPAWEKDWLRAQLREAILLMATSDRAVAMAS